MEASDEAAGVTRSLATRLFLLGWAVAIGVLLLGGFLLRDAEGLESLAIIGVWFAANAVAIVGMAGSLLAAHMTKHRLPAWMWSIACLTLVGGLLLSVVMMSASPEWAGLAILVAIPSLGGLWAGLRTLPRSVD